jgi:hypothetical protein
MNSGYSPNQLRLSYVSSLTSPPQTVYRINMRSKPAALLPLLWLCIVTMPAFAKVASISFDELIQSSDLIVVAKVESVSRPLIGKRYAKATIAAVWKGPKTEKVEFLASPTWTCDISEAKKGETVLLFLIKSDESRSYSIAHSGRGRMPLRLVDAKTYATFWPDIRIPNQTPTIAGPDPKWDFIRSVELQVLRSLCSRAVK